MRNSTEESMLTFMIYLNDSFDASHTEFPWEKIRPLSLKMELNTFYAPMLCIENFNNNKV